MRNLKKVLSLALAMVMLLGMMVVGAGATSFSDDASITHKDAVDVVSGIGVLTGVGDGSFNPEGTLSRAEAAVVIAKLDLGAAFGNLATTNASTFKDVGTGYGWAKPYIDYCAARGLIAGDGNGYFHPGDKVTGVEFGLMVARVLGYEDKAEGVGGATWEVNAAALARKAGLTVDVTLGSQAMTRDDMAQVAFNALQANMVWYQTPGTDINLGNDTITINGSPATPKSYDNTLGDGNEYLQLAEEKFSKLRVTVIDDTFKRPADEWRYADKVIATVVNDATYTLNDGFKGGKMYSTIGKIAAGYPMTVYVDGVEDYTLAGITKAGYTTDFLKAGNGSVTEVFVDTDAKRVTVCVINTYLVKATSNYNATAENLSVNMLSKDASLASNKISNDDVAVSGFNKDDMILVTGTFNSQGKFVVKTAELAETVENVKVSSYNSNNGNDNNNANAGLYVTADGTKYSYSFKTPTSVTTGSYNLQSTGYNLVLDKAGNVIYADRYSNEVTLDNILFVRDAGETAFGIDARAVFMDGTEERISVSATAKATDTSFTETSSDSEVETGTSPNAAGLTTAGNLEKNRFYEFNKKSNGDYELKDIADQGKTNAAGSGNKNIIGGAVKPITGTSASYNANNETIFIAKNTLYTGVKNSPDVTNADVYYLYDGTTLLAAYTRGTGVSVNTTFEYVYILQYQGQGKTDDDKTFNVYTAVKDGEVVTYEARGNAQKTAGLYEIQQTEDGYPVLDNALTTGDSAKEIDTSVASGNISYSKGLFTADNIGLVVDDDPVIYMVDVAKKTVTTIDIDNVNSLENGTYGVYAFYTAKDSKTIKTLWLAKTSGTQSLDNTTSTKVEQELAKGPVVVTGAISGNVTVGNDQTLTLSGSATATDGVTLNGGKLVLNNSALPAVSGTGSVEVEKDFTADITGFMSGAVTTGKKDTVVAVAKSGNTVELSGAGKLTTYSSTKSMSELATLTGSTTFRAMDFKVGVEKATNIKTEFTTDTTVTSASAWRSPDADYGTGASDGLTYTPNSNNEETVTFYVGDKVTGVKITVTTDDAGTAGSNVYYFNVK